MLSDYIKTISFLAVFFGLSCAALASDTAHTKALLKVTVGAFAPPNSPWDADWQTFKKNAEARSKGSVKVKLLVRGETGGEPITMSNIRRGRIQFGGFTNAGGSAVVPELSMMLSPFFFESLDELDYIMDEHMLKVFRPLFAKRGLYLIRWVDVGWLHMYGRSPIVLPEHAAGYRLRSQASEASQTFMTSLGGDMLQMSFQDLIPALQTGLVAGGETGIVIYGVTGLGREAPHLTRTYHAYDTGMIVANHKWFASLPTATRSLIENAFPSSSQARAGVRKMTAFLNAKVNGDPSITVHDLSPAQKARWVQATKDNHKEVIDVLAGDAGLVYQTMLDGKAAYKALQKRDAK